MADEDNRLNEGRLGGDTNSSPDAATPGTGADLPEDDLLGDGELAEDAVLAEADLFDDEEDLVSLDEIEDDADDDVTGQDDDNPYQESDEALPDDQEERSIARDNSREGSPFGEV